MSEGRGDALEYSPKVSNSSLVKQDKKAAPLDLSEPLLECEESKTQETTPQGSEGDMADTKDSSNTKATRIECVPETEQAPLMSSTEEVAEDRSRPKRSSSRFSFSAKPSVLRIDTPEFTSPHYPLVLNFDNTVADIKAAIDQGKQPELVIAGSSGSYWVHAASTGKKVGIFKPKSEEPYGPANPKWAKWFHRVLCPCCFGRSCLLPNTGYVSESAAFAMDVMLDLQVVPPTCVIRLSAKTFNYNAIERRFPKLPTKVGSLQLFVQSNGDGKHLNFDALTEAQRPIFLEQFQRLVVLDYMTRNTDRGLDNWLTFITETEVKIHAIDNGLAFPFKHPDNWRIYPPSWASHPLGKKPFTKTIRKHVLRQIKASGWMNKAEKRLREIFGMDEIFSESRFKGQIAVVRGQRKNLIECLEKEGSTPESLFAMRPLYIIQKANGMVGWRTHLPCFTCC
ncbi:Phosphatidylinositol 4-kinase lsb6 [Diplonema papillatum]|nr:Phosphatidylinositol 4-kinase lsb6 [Diplonema papillatum]